MIEIKNSQDFKNAKWPIEMKAKVEKWWEDRWSKRIANGYIILVFFEDDEIDSKFFPDDVAMGLKQELQLERDFVRKNGGIAAVVHEVESTERREKLEKNRALLGCGEARYNTHGDLRSSGGYSEPHWSH